MTLHKSLKPLWLCSRCASRVSNCRPNLAHSQRAFATSKPLHDTDVQHSSDATSPAAGVNAANTAVTGQTRTIGSRRRRAAIENSDNIPFEQLPYQCFQEALKVLREDRAHKVVQIEDQRDRIARLAENIKTSQASGANKALLDRLKQSLGSSQRHLEWLKVLADINDPLVKRRFEDGLGDLNKPIYRHLAQRKWQSYERKIVMQRITQMHVIPDVLPKVDLTVQVRVSFDRKRVAHGIVVPSLTSEAAPTVHVQPFEAGSKVVSVVVLDSDVPNVKTDSFDHRLHGLVTNVPISPTSCVVSLGGPSATAASLVMPWLPPTAQKGAPWHRLSVWVLEHPGNRQLDVESIKKRYTRESFTLRSFIDKYLLHPIGVTMFRTKWDEGTSAVMERHGIEGANVEYAKKPIEPMRYRKKDGARYR